MVIPKSLNLYTIWIHINNSTNMRWHWLRFARFYLITIMMEKLIAMVLEPILITHIIGNNQLIIASHYQEIIMHQQQMDSMEFYNLINMLSTMSNLLDLLFLHQLLISVLWQLDRIRWKNNQFIKYYLFSQMEKFMICHKLKT